MNFLKTIVSKLKKFIVWFKNASIKKKIGLIIVLFIAIFLITSPLRKRPAQYQTAIVTRETIQETVSESGNIASNGQTGVSSTSTGVIQEVDVANDDKVTAGQTLFKVKATATPGEKAQANAAYLSALATLQSAQAEMNTLQVNLFKTNQAFITDRGVQNPSAAQQADPVYIEENAAWLQAEDNYKNQATVVSQAQSALNNAQLDYQATQDSIVTAPIAGTVENLAYEVGDNVTAGAQTGLTGTTTTTITSTPVLYIVSNNTSDTSLVVVQVNEVDYPKIKKGQTATITLPAFPNKKFTGYVVRKDELGTNTSSVISFNVYIAINNPDPNFAPNMTVDVDINTAKHENALTVPNLAIKPYKGGSAVEVVNKTLPANKQLKYVPVVVGIKGIDKTEILRGVSEGTVVVSGTN